MPSRRTRDRIRKIPFYPRGPRSDYFKARLRAWWTPERRRRIARASADYQAWLKSMGYQYEHQRKPRRPLAERTKENMRRAKTPEIRAKVSRRMSEIQARRKQVKARGVVAVVGWNGKITQLNH